MTKIRFIHCADIHFDTAFSGLPADKAIIRRDELRMNFSKIISICGERNVDFLLISGDLFDSTRVTGETIAFLKDSFNKIPDVHIFISPGNHDPYMPGSRYEEKWPSNVHIFKDNAIEKVTIESLKTNIYGAAFTVPYIEKNLLDNFKCSHEYDYCNIMVMHGELALPGQSNPYNPIVLSSVTRSELNYLALGHRHTFTAPKLAGSTYYSYSGSPEGRGFDESWEKGIIYGEFERTEDDGRYNFKWEFLPCSIRVYKDITANLDGCSTHEEAAARISEVLEDASDLYRITLIGALKDGFLPDLRILESRFNDKYFLIKFRDMTTVEVNLETLAKESMLRGIFAKRMMAKIEEAQKKNNAQDEKFYTDALAIGLKSFYEEMPIYDNKVD